MRNVLRDTVNWSTGIMVCRMKMPREPFTGSEPSFPSSATFETPLFNDDHLTYELTLLGQPVELPIVFHA